MKHKFYTFNTFHINEHLKLNVIFFYKSHTAKIRHSENIEYVINAIHF